MNGDRLEMTLGGRKRGEGKEKEKDRLLHQCEESKEESKGQASKLNWKAKNVTRNVR
jgi:hypothetical protein